MRNLRHLDHYRITDRDTLTITHGWAGDHTCGAFRLKSPTDGAELLVLASTGSGWDHCSVTRGGRQGGRCPNWTEMEYVKRMFFEDNELAVQFHLPVDEHINLHPNCLHLWRSQEFEFGLPPREMV
jgi:hypothetical protein